MDIIRRKANTEYIVLQKAASKTGYASDYIGWLIRTGKVKGKRVYTQTSWQVETEELIKYCQKQKNLETRDFSFFKKKYLSLKEAAEISGYASDYIGWLIRTGKVKGKRVYTGISWQTTEKAIKNYQKRKTKTKGKIFFDFPSYIKSIHLVPESGNKVFGFGWRLSLTALIIFFLVSGFAPIRFLHSSLISAITERETKTINYYPAVSYGDWQNLDNVQELPEIGPSGDINSFNENNSAVYKTGPLALIIEGFVVQEDLGEKEPIIIEEETEELEVISEEVEENETPETEEEIFNPELQTSLFETFKRFFGFKAYAQENTFSAKIKLSFAIGEKESDIQIIEKQEVEPVSSESEPTGFWNKVKNFLVVKAEEGRVENGSLPAEETITAEATTTEPILEETITTEEATTTETTTTPEITERPTTEASLPDLDTRIIIWWSLDGQDWQQLVTISDYPLSNFLNGGYFEYDAPFLKNWDDVKNLKIKFDGMVGGETNVTAYLDSVWVEVEYQEEEKEEEFELKALKKDWRADETPEFEILPKGEKANKNIIEKLVASVSEVFKEKPKVKANLIHPNNEELELREGEDFSAETHSPTKIKIFRQRDFRPGLHKLKVNFEKNGETYNFEQEFTWGVLAINTNKSIYLPGEQAYLQMAVLDEQGHTLCDANLTLEITAPDGTKTIFITEGQQQETTSTLEEATSTEATTTEATTTEATSTEATSTKEVLKEEETTPTLPEATTTETSIIEVTTTEATSTEMATTTEESATTSTSEIATSTTSFWNKVNNPFAISTVQAADVGHLDASEGVIERSEECGPNSVTYTPDYYAYYNVNGAGTYQIKLTSITKNGTHEITDSFEVKDSVPFAIERISPTRIYPLATYEMTLRIKVNQDFQGEIIETVPTSFEIQSSISSFKFHVSGEEKEIIWQVDWKAGGNYELKYTFDAPDTSPYIYLIGPFEIGGFKKIRQWQIVADIPESELETQGPDFETALIKQDVEENGIRVVIIEKGGMLDLWYSLADPISNKIIWRQLTGDGSIDNTSPLGVKGGTIFWLDKNKQTIFGYFIEKQSIFGKSIEPNEEEPYLEFQDENFELWRAVFNPVDSKFYFVKSPGENQ